MSVESMIKDRVNRDLAGDAELGPHAAKLAQVATQLWTTDPSRKNALGLLQVASLPEERPAPQDRGAYARVKEAILGAGMTGIAGGHRAIVSVARWACSEEFGCPLFRTEPLGFRPEYFSWASPTTRSAVFDGPDVGEDEEEDDDYTEDAIERLAAELQSLWWSQSLYSPSQGTSYRKLPPPARWLWMAHDLAQVVPPTRAPAVEALLSESMRRLGEDPDQQLPAAEAVAALCQALDGLPPERRLVVGPPLQEHVRWDPTLLPVTLLLMTHSQKGAEPAILALLPSSTLTLEGWVLQIFRERQLDRWLAGVGA